MFDLIDGLTLYHGSYCEVSTPLLEKCAKRKDFGKGFYLTSSKEQAIKFLNTSIAKAVSNGIILDQQDYGFVSKYELNLKYPLLSHTFKDADVDWLHCVAAYRKRNSFPEIENHLEKYDVIIGKIADDTTNATLTAYIAGAYGTVGSREADEFCIKRLLPEKLKNQYCFKTTTALECLRFIGGEKIWLKK